MRVKVFDTIDDTLKLLAEKREEYHGMRKEIKHILFSVLSDKSDRIMDISSRVKSAESLREKIIRNRMYVKYATSEEILANLSDGIGLKIECRFMDEEHTVYTLLQNAVAERKEDGYSSFNSHPHVSLDLRGEQPQIQKNGFTIYRIDGYYEQDKVKTRFELQIKSLVNSFWGDIEHKLVYKNTNYYVYDDFMKRLLSSIKSNLSIIDAQLRIVYDEMESGDRNQMGLVSEENFEKFLAKAINDLFTEKLKDSIGFTINIKKTSNILGHYIFVKNIRDHIGDEHSGGLFNIFKKLNGVHIDFSEEIEMESKFCSNNEFSKRLGNYLIDQLNKDYEWYVFFKMLFALEEGNNIEDFTLFMMIYLDLLVDHYWFKTSFVKLEHHDAQEIHDRCLLMLANVLIECDTIKIIYNENLNSIKTEFVHFIEVIEARVVSLKDFIAFEQFYTEDLLKRIKGVL